MKSEREDEVFRGLRRTPIPNGLKERVLGAARSHAVARRASWVDRLWENRALRLAWAFSVLLLLVANLIVAAGALSLPQGKARRYDQRIRELAGISASAACPATFPERLLCADDGGS
jgi:hypothetical protein